ncbi:hypothetical protein B0H10DRAFT_2185720 [Mycena sp. CBHHK59/15]|nr:hypothetical protein B0H10DRAFT_2185720 [Mycena sp. CBHHK59/15]
MVSKKVVPVTVPMDIPVDGGKLLRTTIDPRTQKHHVTCDLCDADFTLTVTANPRRFFDHRGGIACTSREDKREERRQKALTLKASAASISGSVAAQLSPVHRPYFPAGHSTPSGSRTPTLHMQRSLHVQTASMNYVTETVVMLAGNPSVSRALTIESASRPIIVVHLSLVVIQSDHDFMERSGDAAEHTPWDYLTAQQHKALLAKTCTQIKKLRTQLENSKRTQDVLHHKLTDHQRIMMLLKTDDVPALWCILISALKRGASPQVIYSLLKRAIAGLFTAWGGFTDRDLDIAFLIKSIGGPRLLYALQKSHGLASRSTVMRNQAIPRLQTSIVTLSREEIDVNISALLNPLIKPPPVQSGHEKLVGHAVMFDGVETKCRYCPHCNAILGLCWEHSDRVKNQVTNLQSIEDIETIHTALFSPATKDDKVCFGSDATVVAIAPYGRNDHYTPSPIVVSPSDKTEKGLELAKWMQTVITSWQANESGESVHGPIWALASDGDAAYRLAKHTLCMVKKLDPASDLGKILHPLIGLNLLTSIHNILWTGDPKHIWKRQFGTLARNPLGFMIFMMNIKPENIIKHLCELDEMTEDKARQLLDPADKQNVPKAVGLIQQLVLGYFVFPFITVDMDLSEQVRSLATYAHLSAALQLKHGSACFTGPLYADSQATIKNIIFIIAWMQLINPNLCFWILHEGTDRLELIFSDCCTLDHPRNFDIDQLASKLSLSALISAAFQHNPDLDRGHRCLSLKGALRIDHVNPKSWTGNVCIGDVNLACEWEAGQIAANHILKKYFGSEAQVDFVKIFSQPDRDFLRPAGHYVGVKETADGKCSEAADGHPLLPLISTESNPMHPPVVTQAQRDVTALSDSDASSVEEDQPDPMATSELLEEPLGMDLDDFLPESIEVMDSDKPSAATEKYLEASDGRKYLKSSLVASLSSNRTKKVTMRTLRAQGVALEDLQRRKSMELDLLNLNDEDVMKAGDLAATLFQYRDQVCLAVLMVKGFQLGTEKSPCTIIEMDRLDDVATNIRIIAQVMELENPRTSALLTSPGENFWEWTGNFIMLNVDATSLRMKHRQLILEVPSVVVHPLGPSVATRTVFKGGMRLESSSNKPMWRIDSEQLNQVMNSIWLLLDPERAEMLQNRQLLLSINNPRAVPYSDSIVIYHLQYSTAFGLMPKLSAKSIVECLICGKDSTLNKMCEHVGAHILLSLRGVEEPAPVITKRGGIVAVCRPVNCFEGILECRIQPSQSWLATETRKYDKSFKLRRSNDVVTTPLFLSCHHHPPPLPSLSSLDLIAGCLPPPSRMIQSPNNPHQAPPLSPVPCPLKVPVEHPELHWNLMLKVATSPSIPVAKPPRSIQSPVLLAQSHHSRLPTPPLRLIIKVTVKHRLSRAAASEDVLLLDG